MGVSVLHVAALVVLCLICISCEKPRYGNATQQFGRRKRGVPDVFVGSKLGTSEYKSEIAVIDQGIEDYAEDLSAKMSRKDLLCVTFLGTNSSHPPLIYSNIRLMDGVCDWALIFYNGNQSAVDKVCNDPRANGHWVHCKRNAETLQERFMPVPATNATSKKIRISVPKTVFYRDLLPYLPNYKKVFLLDEDISLEGFNITKFLSHWQCSFSPPPLVVQPLVFESNQYINYLNLNSWRRGNRKEIVASGVGLVEQQVPLFDARFFEWFVRRVLAHTYTSSLRYGVDWGHDRSWCNAAAMYARLVLRYALPYTPCAVLPRAGAIHHLNHRSISAKRDHRAAFHRNGVQVVQHYIDLYPTWVVTDVLSPNNPLDHRNFEKYPRLTVLNETCMGLK